MSGVSVGFLVALVVLKCPWPLGLVCDTEELGEAVTKIPFRVMSASLPCP